MADSLLLIHVRKSFTNRLSPVQCANSSAEPCTVSPCTKLRPKNLTKFDEQSSVVYLGARRRAWLQNFCWFLEWSPFFVRWNVGAKLVYSNLRLLKKNSASIPNQTGASLGLARGKFTAPSAGVSTVYGLASAVAAPWILFGAPIVFCLAPGWLLLLYNARNTIIFKRRSA